MRFKFHDTVTYADASYATLRAGFLLDEDLDDRLYRDDDGVLWWFVPIDVDQLSVVNFRLDGMGEWV